MATSKIELFQTEITIERNAMIDEIDTYLNTCNKTYSVDNFQYQQLASNMTFVIALPQSRFQGKTNIGNYVRLTQDNKEWYFFITSVSWQSMNACSLNCLLDTINTFKDLVFSDETSISREHKNRVLKVAANKYYRIVDKESEGIYPLKYQTRKDTIYDEGDNLNWYLIYSTRDDLTPDNITNPIACYLCADSELLVEKGSTETSKVLTYSDFQENYYYYLVDLDNEEGQFATSIRGETSEQVYTLGNTYSLLATATTRRDRVLRGITIMRQGTSLYAQYMYNGNVYWQSSDGTSHTTSNPPVRPNDGLVISSNGFREINNITLRKARLFRYSSNLYTYPERVPSIPYRVNYFIGYDSRYINSIDEIDRTDSRLMKILLLPYCPTTYTKDNDGVYVFDDKWYYDSGLLRLSGDNLNLEFLNNITKLQLNELVVNDYLNPNRTRSIQWESKLYHSDYYSNKLTYDSYSIDIPLEKIYYKQEVPSDTPEVEVVYKQTNTINSNSLFALDFNTSSQVGYRGEYDYDNIMIVSRNNEEPIFNNGYVDYIRTGYNYDKKLNSLALQQQVISGIFGSVASGTQFLGSLGAYSSVYQGYLQTQDENSGLFNSYKSYREYLNDVPSSTRKKARREQLSTILPRGISTAASIASTITNAIYTSQSQATSMQQKLTQLASQSSTVSGSNDIDLLKYYNGNKLENFRYNIKAEEQQALYNMFNYIGYTSVERKVPRMDSRYWFNYIQCSPIFKHENLYPYNDYLDDIKSRYESGITIYHTHNGKYDFDREKENVEVDCLLPNLIDDVEVDDTQFMWTYGEGYDWVDDGMLTYWMIYVEGTKGDFTYDTLGIDNCQVFDYDREQTGTINKIILRKYNVDWDLYSKEYVWNREE